ncbi:MAG: hypothetical protein E6248_13580 [Clostridium sp.]|uniref:hypothetical protein n=1 Tax=Clostridium sp. TaxID=1506 RepID=UPI0029159B92|nr:hypothetical protein [Clostridium sp.]MDU5111471.1 hypothetical protein [Clostridium sp.]
MENNKFCRILEIIGVVILITGMIGGVLLMVSKSYFTIYYGNPESISLVNLILGTFTIVISVFLYVVCEWMIKMLQNSTKQTELMATSRDLLEIINSKKNNDLDL